MSGETYVKRYPGGFVDLPATSTAIDSSYLNGTEAALARLLGADPADANVMVWDQSLGRFKTVLLTNAHVAAAAAISRTKLDFGAGLLDADIAPGAAVAQSKIAGLVAGLDARRQGEELAHAQITASVTVNATVEASADTVVTAPAVTFDGTTAAVIEFYSPLMAPASVVGGSIIVYLFQDGASLGFLTNFQNPAAAALRAPVFVRRRLTPAAGSRTYSIRATNGSGVGTVGAGTGGAGSYVPAFIRITRV